MRRLQQQPHLLSGQLVREVIDLRLGSCEKAVLNQRILCCVPICRCGGQLVLQAGNKRLDSCFNSGNLRINIMLCFFQSLTDCGTSSNRRLEQIRTRIQIG